MALIPQWDVVLISERVGVHGRVTLCDRIRDIGVLPVEGFSYIRNPIYNEMFASC